MLTPLKKLRGLGPAHSGTEHFWLQRVTAIANLPLVIYFVFLVATLSGSSHAAVAATLGEPLVAILLLGAILSIALHMRAGMQMIIEDYVHEETAKVTLLLANTFFTIAIALAAAFAVLRINFGL